MLAPAMTQAKPNTTVDCNVHKIFCDILKVRPSINRSYAMELSNYIYKWTRYYGVDPKLSVAIGRQESGLINKDRRGVVLTKTGKKVHGVTDIGVFQLHVATLAAMDEELGWNIDYSRLRSDLDYQTQLHVRWLKHRIRVCNISRIAKKRKVIPGSEWACYHSYTKSRRKIYIKDVRQYLVKIIDQKDHKKYGVLR